MAVRAAVKPAAKPEAVAYRFEPLTPDRWGDVARLFGPRGACAGCWCMWWKETRREFQARAGASNRRAFRRIVASGAIPGILAYADGRTVGWCAVEPRDRFVRLARSRTLAPVDDAPVWSVVCFFIARGHRRRGLQERLLRAAVAHAGKRGARVVEGYPVDPGKGGRPDAWMWSGIASAFRKAGFVEAGRRARTRPVMRYHLSGRGPRRNGRRKSSARVPRKTKETP